MEWGNLLNSLSELPFDPYVHAIVTALSLVGKLFLLFFFLRTSFNKQEGFFLALLLTLFLLGTIYENILHLIGIFVREIWKTEQHDISIFAYRVHWSLFVTFYQALALFLLRLTQKEIHLDFWQIAHGIVNIILSSCFLYIAFFKFGVPSTDEETLTFHVACNDLAVAYILVLFMAVFYKVHQNIGNQKTPLILASQTQYLLMFSFIQLIFEILDTATSKGSWLSYYITCFFPPDGELFSPKRYLLYTLKTALTTYAAYFAIKKIMGLRFLNIRKTIQSKQPFNFLEQFQDIIDQLNITEDIRAVIYPVQSFFSTAFAIPLKQTHLFIRKNNSSEKAAPFAANPELFTKVEQFLALDEHKALVEAFRSAKICVREDIHFTQFCEDDDTKSTEMLQFLDAIQADIFLPIFERGSLVAYIIIEQGARTGKLFTNKERDEMLVFTSYLSNIINVLLQSTVHALHVKVKRLSDELYTKHQENNQLRECLRSFMQSEADRKIGIIFYKRKFTFANESAEQIVGFDLNKSKEHPLAQAISSVAHLVQQYKSSQSTFAYDLSKNKVCITGLLGQDGFSVILYIYYPDISESIKDQLSKLKDPSHFDYLLYLETTQSGRLVNKLIQGSSEKILNFKVQLLATALSKRATLLHLPENDTLPAVEILHVISLRETLHILKLVEFEKNHDIAITLFGLSPFIEKNRPALLEKLNKNGTLFIQNVELLSVETQNLLASFLARGFFNYYKSDHKIFSDVRVICSSHQNLKLLVAEGDFSALLYEELQPTSLTLSSLHAFSQEEVTEIPQSNPITTVSSDEIIDAAVRLGKKALRDPHMMTALWHTFKSRSKIATLLRVHISSVSRWCEKLDLK